MNNEAIDVLLVDDEEDHAELIRRGLAHHASDATEFRLQVAASLAEARAMLARHTPDLMIVDYRLPDGEGIELLPGSFEKREFPIILMTGHGDQTLAVNALKSGAMDYVVKTEATMADMHKTCEHAMHEWRYIKERRKALQQLSNREVLIKRMFQAAPTGIYMVVNQKISFVNEHLSAMLGYEADELVGNKESVLFCNDQEFKRSSRLVADQIGKSGIGSVETRFTGKHGNIMDIWLGAAPVDAGNLAAGITFTALDITERKKAEADMRFMASHDSLTGLANRNLFVDRMTSALAMARRHKSGVATMFLDLDDFKEINDSMGHDVGDIVLQQVATRIMDCLRESDSTSRFGGDEFLVLLPMTAGREAVAGVAAKIIAAMSRPFEINDHVAKLGCSIGIAMFPEHGKSPEELINKADAAMYEAKQSGKNAWLFAH